MKIKAQAQGTWRVLQHSDRHGSGCEKIRLNSLKSELPVSISSMEDVNFLLAFRFDGLKPFVGHRNRFIFHVLYIDRDFTLYKH